MRCFRKTVHKQHLEDEVRWLQQMLAKEQQSKQAALGQLQDERAKCAMLEMEILHAAQAAQEMGESLCLFFNPCYQQSEQQVHPHMHPLSCADVQPDAEPVQQQEQQEVQSPEHDYQHAQQEVQQEPQQEQHSQAQCDLVSNPDTAAHDQAHLRLWEQAALTSSADHWALQNEPLLAGPLKVSPGRRNSPRRLARSSPRRSLRISSSSSSPMKQVGAAAGSAAQVPEAASAATSSQPLQSNKETGCGTEQLGLAAAEDSAADLPTDTDHKVLLDQHRTELEMSSSAQQQGPKQDPELQQQQAEGDTCLSEAAVEASSGAAVTPGMAAALHQNDGVQGDRPDRVQGHLAAAAATLAAAAAVAAGQGHVQAATLPSRHGKAGQSPFSAAAAAAAAIQQSVSAASAAIAAAEAARGKGCSQVQAGPVVLLAPFGSVLSDTPGGRVGREAVQASEDCDTASSSSGSGKGCTSHALPHSIVAHPATVALEVEHSSTQPEEKSGSTAAEIAGQDQQQQQQQQPPSSAQGTASSLRAAASLPSSNTSAASGEMNEAKPSSSSTSTATTNSDSSSSRSRSNDSRPVTSAQEGSLHKPAAASGQVLEGPTEHEPTEASSGTQNHKPGVAQELQEDDSSVPSGILDVSAKLPAPAQVPQPQPTPACVHPTSAGLDSGRHTNSSAGKGGSTEADPEPHSPAAAPSSTADATGALGGGRHCSAVEQSTAGSEQVLPASVVRPSASSSDGMQCSNSSIKHEQAMPAAIEHQQQQQDEHQKQQQLAGRSQLRHLAAGSSLAAAKAFGQDSTARTSSSVSGSTWPGPVHPGIARVQPGKTLQQKQQQQHHVPTGFFSNGLPAQSQAQPRDVAYRQVDAWQLPQQLQQHRQAGRSSQQHLPCKDVAAVNLQPLLPRPQSLHRSAVAAAAAANGSTARSGALQPAAAAAAASMHTGQQPVCMQAVDGGAAVELAPSSCLSPLHWHQANLGSSRPGFYQAMMLSACSNPCSVMRQQLAFEQQDTKAQTAHSKLGQGSRAGKALRSGINKPRKGWMALF